MASNLEPSPATRQKQDVAWKHCQLFREGDKEHMKCKYCGKVFKGGGITRFKEHLAGRKGGGPMCLQVPPDVRLLMEQCLDAVAGKLSGRKTKMLEEGTGAASSPIEVRPLAACLASPDPESVLRTPRGKTDIAWQHCHLYKNDKRGEIKCKYCGKVFKGGGIHRFKEHLAGRNSGGVPVCNQVPPDVRELMLQKLNEIPYKPKKKRKSVVDAEDDDDSPPSDMDTFACHSDDQIAVDRATKAGNLIEPNSNLFPDAEGGTSNTRKRGRGKTSSAVVAVDNAPNPSGLKKAGNEIHVTTGRFLYDIGACLDAPNSHYFQPFIDSLVSGGSGVMAPSHHDLRGWILKKLVDEVKNEVDQYRTIWGRTGCSILVEEWSTDSGTKLLNFLVYCTKGTVFLKSVDASRFRYSADDLCGSLKEVVEAVGAGNVLQVITNADEHYAIAGKKLMNTFPSLYWAPYAANCIDLILEDFVKLEWIHSIIEQARSVTRFVYNHSALLNMMRKFTHGNDIVQQGATRSATNFTTLQRMADFKLNLQTMVTSQEWMDCPYAKQLGGLAMVDIISNRSFWSSCISIIRLTTPLLRVFEIVNSEKRAPMGYVFSGMYRAKETIKKELVKRDDYICYWNIIHNRWEQWQPPLHAAGFFLNPKFFYRIQKDMHNEILTKVYDCIERLVPDAEVQDNVVKELNFYKDADGDLGRKMAIRARETLLPAEWWSAYGGGCPNLARFAIRILSQTCSSVGCRPDHIPFEKAHAARNCLERQRLTDLVFVKYNLRLKQMVNGNKNQHCVDPISFDKVNIVEDWIMQNELCLEEYENLDWMSLVPPFASTLPSGSSTDEAEDLGAEFDDFEVFDGLKGN